MQLVYDPGEEAPAFTASDKGKGRAEPAPEEAKFFGGGAPSNEEGECNEKTAKWIQEQSDFEMAKRLQREFDQEDTDPPSRSDTTTQPLVTRPTDQRPLHVTATSHPSGSSASPTSVTAPMSLLGLTQLRVLDLLGSCGPWCYGECDKYYLHLYGTDVTDHEIWRLWDPGAGNTMHQTGQAQEPRGADPSSGNISTTVGSLGDDGRCASEGSGGNSSKEMQEVLGSEMAKCLQKEFDKEAGDIGSGVGDGPSDVYEGARTGLGDCLLLSNNQGARTRASNPKLPTLHHVPAYPSPLRLGYYGADEGTYISTTGSKRPPNSLQRNVKRHGWDLKKGSPLWRQLLIGLGFFAKQLCKRSGNGCTCEYERDELLGEPEIFSTIPRVTLKGLPRLKERCGFCSGKNFEQLEYRGCPDIPDDDTVVGGGDDESDDEGDEAVGGEEDEEYGYSLQKYRSGMSAPPPWNTHIY